MSKKLSAAPPAKDALRIIDIGDWTRPQRRRVSAPGFRAFLNIAEAWGLSEKERLAVLGKPDERSTYHLWAAKVRSGGEMTLSLDALLRISALLGIYKALHVIFPRQENGLAWLRSPNAGLAFGGQCPLDLMTSGTQDGLMVVRRHLDAWRGGVFSAPVANVDAATEPLRDEDIVFL